MKRNLLIAILIAFVGQLFAQDEKLTLSYDVIDNSPTEKILQIKAKGNGFKIVSIAANPAETSSNVEWKQSSKILIKDSLTEKGNATKLATPALAEYNINGYDDVVWEQKLILPETDSIARVEGKFIVYYDDKTGGLLTQELEIDKQIKKTVATAAQNNVSGDKAVAGVAKKASTSDKDIEKKSLLGLLIAGFLAGLVGFVTPCVYALVPVTVSMFMKRSKSPKQGRNNVLAYAGFIMLIYTVIGLCSGIFFDNDDLQRLSAHWIFNLSIFVLFVVFGLSFLGWFEISLPSSWATKMDSKANTSSYAGIFFMALTLVIVSFSCTGPFVGSLLGASFKNGKLGPMLGLFGFGLGLAAPFAIFAVFPKLITVLTKSGGWQNALKVTLGFIELAASLKFLSQADLIKNWRILDREVFIVLWIVIFLMLTLYLIGKIRFKLDSELPKNDFGLEYIPVPRLILAITSLGFVFYLIPGLWGAPLNAVSGFIPPMGTQDFNLTKKSESGGGHQIAANGIAPVKWVNELKSKESAEAQAAGFTVFYDFDEAKAAAKAAKKPLLIDITGITCVNCRKFEGAIWSKPQVSKAMANDFVILSLFLDAPMPLDDDKRFKSDKLGRVVKTLGDYNKDISLNMINSETMPNYIFLGDDGKLLHQEGYGYEPSENAQAFYEHLQMVTAEYKKRFP